MQIFYCKLIDFRNFEVMTPKQVPPLFVIKLYNFTIFPNPGYKQSLQKILTRSCYWKQKKTTFSSLHTFFVCNSVNVKTEKKTVEEIEGNAAFWVCMMPRIITESKQSRLKQEKPVRVETLIFKGTARKKWPRISQSHHIQTFVWKKAFNVLSNCITWMNQFRFSLFFQYSWVFIIFNVSHSIVQTQVPCTWVHLVSK